MDGTALRRFETSQALFHQGETSREMYIIRSGTVKVLVTRNGKTVPIIELGKGAFVGEMSFLSGIPRTATVTAAEPVTASVIGPESLAGGALGISEWVYSISKILVERLRKTTILLGDYRSAAWGIEIGEDPPVEPDYGFKVQSGSVRDPARLRLSGRFLSGDIETLKTAIREHRTKCEGPIVLDFSEVIDLDNEGLSFLSELVRVTGTKEKKILIENVQLLQNKVLAIKGIQGIINSTQPEVRRVGTGEMLLRQGDMGTTMFIVKSGCFKVFRTVEARIVDLGLAESGDVLGEMTLIEEGYRAATVEAVKPSFVYEIKTKDFYKNIYNVPDWFMKIIRGLVVRLRQTNEMIDFIVKNRETGKDEQKAIVPLSITVDAKDPGRFALEGSLVAENLDCFNDLVRLKTQKGTQSIEVDLSRVERIDEESVAYLLNLFMELKAAGGKLSLLGPPNEILLLFRQYDIEI